MRAAVMEGVKNPLIVTDVKEPSLQPGGAILHVEANGVRCFQRV